MMMMMMRWDGMGWRVGWDGRKRKEKMLVVVEETVATTESSTWEVGH